MGCGGSKGASAAADGGGSKTKAEDPKVATSGGDKEKPPAKRPDKVVYEDANFESVDEYYDIGEEIGRGAFSVVKSGVDKSGGDNVAVKCIDKAYVDNQDLVLLSREIDIMKKVKHPNVLNLFHVFESDSQISLVMELVDGGELFYKIVEKGNYSEADAAAIVKQMCQGVAYLHGEGIAHRDLKPENLLCASSDGEKFNPFRVVIADFGLSKIFDGGEALETSCGTPDYVAPEVITAEGSYDKSVDMWSAGVITYVLLCGFSPFLSSTQTGLFEKILKCEYDFPDPEWTGISQGAKDFISALLVQSPDDRLTAEQALAHPWLNSTDQSSSALGGGAIASKMNEYNEARKAELRR
jgi:calcium/calmodulin-dependent protein kinase I